MFEDIVESLNKAMILQKWNEGDRFHRIGNPFQYVDVDVMPGWRSLNELDSFLKFFTMFYEEYPTPDVIKCDDFEDIFKEVRQGLSQAYRKYFPWKPEHEHAEYRDILAKRRTEDYGFIKSFSDLRPPQVRHLDIGPGLGSHSLYSRLGFKSQYCGIEAHPEVYQVQRNFFRCFSSMEAPYLDFVAAETFGVPDGELTEIIRSQPEGIIHVPSWKFPVIPDEHFDLMTASWVLNEVNVAGILWLMSESMRTLKPGGYIYIRDSGQRKPGRHDIDYDGLLLELGFSEVGRLRVSNRVEFHGVPRMYKKTDVASVPSFDELADRTLGHFGISNQLGWHSLRRQDPLGEDTHLGVGTQDRQDGV